MDGTILGQGSFQSFYSGTNPNPGNAELQAGSPVIIQVPSAADWVKVTNYTSWLTAGDSGVYFNGVANASLTISHYWQRGMPAGSSLVTYYDNLTQNMVGDALGVGGLTIYDPTGMQAGSQPILGNPVATVGSSNATRPVITVAGVGQLAGLSVGSVVRLSGTGQQDVDGIDFVVGAVTTGGPSFTLLTASNPLANAPGAVGGAGFYRIVNWPPLFYPARKTVVNVTQSAIAAQISTATEHSLTVGQAVRFNIPVQAGMVQLNTRGSNNYMYSTVTSIVDAYNFTINTNTLNFTAFSWPTVAQQASSFPTVEPIGANTSAALAANNNVAPMYQGQPIFNANTGVFADATVNTGYYGMILGSGGPALGLGGVLVGPAGFVTFNAANVMTAGSTVYWVSGKADFGGL